MTPVLDPRRETEITLAEIDLWLNRVETNIAAIRDLPPFAQDEEFSDADEPDR